MYWVVLNMNHYNITVDPYKTLPLLVFFIDPSDYDYVNNRRSWLCFFANL